MESKKEFDKRYTDAVRAADRIVEQYAKSKGLNYMQLMVLDEICAMEGTCTQKMICEHTHYPKQSVNLIVKHYVEKGYLELKENPKDRRNKFIILSDSGKEYVANVVYPFWQADEKATMALTNEQREVFLETLEIYSEVLQEQLKQA